MEPSLLHLPGPVLLAVLRQLSARDALSAACTCSQLRAAAAATVDSIDVEWLRDDRLDSLLLYLEEHGQHVTSLRAHKPDFLDHLPASCSRLQALTLDEGCAQLGAGGGQPGVLQAVSALTSLRIDGCELAGSATAAAIARLPRLQRLELRPIMLGGGVLPGSMLAPLTALTALRLDDAPDWLQATNLGHLSSLRGLRELRLSVDVEALPLCTYLGAVQHLPQLTALYFQHVIGFHSLPSLSSSLRLLDLWDCPGFEVQTLVACTQLQHVSIDSSRLWLAGRPEGGTAALLAHLQRCTQLTHLLLADSFGDTQPAAAAYAGLTASSSLEVLQLQDTKLPLAALQPMFGGNKRFPRLRGLWLTFKDGAGAQPADLAELARCCPALQGLHLWGLPPDVARQVRERILGQPPPAGNQQQQQP